jgi:hypothetical protein
MGGVGISGYCNNVYAPCMQYLRTDLSAFDAVLDNLRSSWSTSCAGWDPRKPKRRRSAVRQVVTR